MSEFQSQQHEQLLDDIGIQTEIINTESNDKFTSSPNSYHKLPSVESVIIDDIPIENGEDILLNNINNLLNNTDNNSNNNGDKIIEINCNNNNNSNNNNNNNNNSNNNNSYRPLIRYGNELLIDHTNMEAISIGIVGESFKYVLRLFHSISLGRIPSNVEFSLQTRAQSQSQSQSQTKSQIYSEYIKCPYRTRLIPVQLTCISDITDNNNNNNNDISVWIIVVSPENADINSWYTTYHGEWNNIIQQNYPKSRRIIACVQPVDQIDDESSSCHISNFDVRVKHVALYNMSSINELFEKAISISLDDNFCRIMKLKYSEYCVRNISYASLLWNIVEIISPWIWCLNLFFNLILISYSFIFGYYTFGILFCCIFLLLNILLTYQFIKIYCRSDNIDTFKLIIIFLCGFIFGFLIPLFAYIHYKSSYIKYKLSLYIRRDINESSLNDFSSNVPIRKSCWGFAIYSITFTLPFTFLLVLMMILNDDNSIEIITTLFINMLTLLINSWCLIFTRTDRYAFIFAWICVILDIFSGVLSILLTFYIKQETSIFHSAWWLKIYICCILSLGFEFLNIAESWEHITSGFFELLDHFRSYVSPIPRFQCIGAILAILFISLGGLIIFFIFQTLGMIIFMFALYFLNWSWCLSLLDDQVMHEFDELYSSLINFILLAHNDNDYSLRLSVVNYELNPFTKKMKYVNYELLDMIHLKPNDWLYHGKKYFSEHFLWGAIGGYHYQKEKWDDCKTNAQHNNTGVNSIKFNQKFIRLFWIGFFGCSAYIFQPLYTLIILFSNLYPILIYANIIYNNNTHIPTVIHIMMIIYLLLIPLFIKYLHRASKFAYTLFHIVSARKKLYKRPRQLFESQDSMKFFARVWKHYIYVHVTLLRNQMIEEYFGDLYKEVLSLLSPLQRMDNLIQLYEDMYDNHCGRVNIKFADFVAIDDNDNTQTIINNDNTHITRHRKHRHTRHHHHHQHRSSTHRTHVNNGTTNPHKSSHHHHHSRKHGNHHNALLYDAEHKKRRRLRKTKKTLLLDRSLIDLIDNNNKKKNNNNNNNEIDDDTIDIDDDIKHDYLNDSHDDIDDNINNDPHNSNDSDSDINLPSPNQFARCITNDNDIEEEEYDGHGDNNTTNSIQLEIEENKQNTNKKPSRLLSTSSLSLF